MIKKLRIAVDDDEADMRDFFERMLPKCGHQVVAVAETGLQLVEHCRRLQPDLVITDIKMPDMDGIAASDAICAERPVPVILVSAYHDTQLIDRATADHVMGYLVKPIGQADLEPAIAIAVRRFQQFEDVRREASDLRQALSDRKVIELAKGILMKATGADEKDAFRRLQELANERKQKLVEAAQSVIAMERVFRPTSA